MGFWGADFQWVSPKAWLICTGAISTYFRADADGAHGQAVSVAFWAWARGLPVPDAHATMPAAPG